MDLTGRQTPINISGTVFPRFKDNKGSSTERFWYVKFEFEKHPLNLSTKNLFFTRINARLWA